MNQSTTAIPSPGTPGLVAAPTQALPGARGALMLLLAINLFNYIDRQVLSAVEPAIRNDLLPGDPDAKTKTGLLASAFLLTYMAIAPLFGWLGDRVPRWRLVGIGVILWSLASGAAGLAGALPAYGVPSTLTIAGWTLSGAFVFLFLTRCLVGVGEGAYGPIAPTMISDLYPVELRSSKLAWFYVAFPVGSCLGYALGGLMSSTDGQFLGSIPLGWRWAFYLVVPPGILLGVWCFFMREPVRGASDGATKRRARLVDYLVLLRTPSYTLNTLGMTGMTFALGGLAFWVPAYLEERAKVGETTKVFGLDGTTVFGGITVLAGLTATLSGGYLGDKLRTRFSGSYFLVSGVAMLIAFPLVMGVVKTPFPICWLLIFGAAFCLFFNTGPSNTALANVMHPAVRATGFALNIFFIHAFGDAISPPIVGWLADRFSLDMGFQAISASVLVGGLIWIVAARYLQRDTELAPARLPSDA